MVPISQYDVDALAYLWSWGIEGTGPVRPGPVLTDSSTQSRAAAIFSTKHAATAAVITPSSANATSTRATSLLNWQPRSWLLAHGAQPTSVPAAVPTQVSAAT